MNAKHDIAAQGLQYFARSIAPLRGCEDMARRCNIKSRASFVGTVEVQRVESFDCPRPATGSNSCTCENCMTEREHPTPLTQLVLCTPQQCRCGFSLQSAQGSV
jgi:hypothetical protein